MIRLAKEQDLTRVDALYQALLSREETVLHTNWQKGLYPTVAHAKEAFEQGTLYVGEEDGALFGCVNLNQIQPPEYGQIRWNFQAEPEEIMVIHTLCIHPDFAGRGKGKEFVRFCEGHAQAKNWPVIRLDTYEGNFPACRLYEGLGYSYAGQTQFHFQNVIWETLKCFDKKI